MFFSTFMSFEFAFIFVSTRNFPLIRAWITLMRIIVPLHWNDRYLGILRPDRIAIVTFLRLHRCTGSSARKLTRWHKMHSVRERFKDFQYIKRDLKIISILCHIFVLRSLLILNLEMCYNNRSYFILFDETLQLFQLLYFSVISLSCGITYKSKNYKRKKKRRNFVIFFVAIFAM